jgi:hypothetical protein
MLVTRFRHQAEGRVTMQQEFNDPLWRTVLSGAQMLFVSRRPG